MNVSDEEYLKHVGVLGMKWGHRRAEGGGGEKKYHGAFSKNRPERIKVANELEAVRRRRKLGTKIGDWFLSGPNSQKLFSEKHGRSETAKKGSELSNKLEEMRKQRDRGEKVLDFLLTPGYSTKKFTELPAKSRRKVVVLTAACMAGAFGLMKVTDLMSGG